MATDLEGIRVERFRSDNIDELIEAQNSIFSDYIIRIESTRQFFADFLRSVGGSLSNILVAKDGDRIVGYVNPVYDEHQAWIGGIGVVPEYRRRGIGRILMSAAESECRKRGVDTISLEVIEGNDRAQRLYETLGYAGVFKYVTAEAMPARFQGYGDEPAKATIADIIHLHERSYKHTCWQRRKTEALVQSARGAECYKVDGGFVLVRAVDTSGFIPFLGVVPERRGKGIGTILARFALSRLHDLGAFKVTVYNANEDLPTMRLLDTFNFKVTMKQLEMRKKL